MSYVPRQNVTLTHAYKQSIYDPSKHGIDDRIDHTMKDALKVAGFKYDRVATAWVPVWATAIWAR